MMRAAAIYERKGKLFVHSSSRTTAGVWIATAPALATDKEHLSELGHHIAECLKASREGVPHPSSFGSLFDPVLDLAGVKSFSIFAKSSKCVGVETADGQVVTLVPTRNEGAEGGFSPLSEKIEVTITSDDALGSAALAALAISE